MTKPRHAGARILCLDGYALCNPDDDWKHANRGNRGGIRGIIQLHVLQELERILGPDLPIQLFFDLIVGTE